MDEKPIEIHFDFSRLANAQLEEFGLNGADVIRAVANPVLLQCYGEYGNENGPVVAAELRDGWRVKVRYENPAHNKFTITRIEYWKPRTTIGDGSRLA
jgi:hypothetical protein